MLSIKLLQANKPLEQHWRVVHGSQIHIPNNIIDRNVVLSFWLVDEDSGWKEERSLFPSFGLEASRLLYFPRTTSYALRRTCKFGSNCCLGYTESVSFCFGSGCLAVSRNIRETGIRPRFNDCVQSGVCPENSGCVVYYSNRCPYSEYHVKTSLVESCEKRKLPLTIIKLETWNKHSRPQPQ